MFFSSCKTVTFYDFVPINHGWWQHMLALEPQVNFGQHLPSSGNADNKWSVLKGDEKLHMGSEWWGVSEGQQCGSLGLAQGWLTGQTCEVNVCLHCFPALFRDITLVGVVALWLNVIVSVWSQRQSLAVLQNFKHSVLLQVDVAVRHAVCIQANIILSWNS